VRVFLMVNPSVPAKNLNGSSPTRAQSRQAFLRFGGQRQLAAHRRGDVQARGKDRCTHVPYKGAAPALNDLLGGQVQFMFDPGPGLQHAATGKS
jgi:tripartite-type tricarboxylate transporter receptor subunit TctC